MYPLCNLPFFALERQSIFMTVIQNLVIMSMSILFCLLFLLVGLFVRSFVCFTSNIKRNTQNYYYSGQKSQGRFHARHSGIQIQKCSGRQSQNHGAVPNRKTPERV